MAGLDPAIHVLAAHKSVKAWIIESRIGSRARAVGHYFVIARLDRAIQ
jgi:hypothetical protein